MHNRAFTSYFTLKLLILKAIFHYQTQLIPLIGQYLPLTDAYQPSKQNENTRKDKIFIESMTSRRLFASGKFRIRPGCIVIPDSDWSPASSTSTVSIRTSANFAKDCWESLLTADRSGLLRPYKVLCADTTRMLYAPAEHYQAKRILGTQKNVSTPQTHSQNC